MVKMLTLCTRLKRPLQQVIELVYFFSDTGVADGVGGWSSYGVDPSKFSWGLMELCQKTCAASQPLKPKDVLKIAFEELVRSRTIQAGKLHFGVFISRQQHSVPDVSQPAE